MRMQLEVAIRVALFAVTMVGTASAESQNESPAPDRKDTILEALELQPSVTNSGKEPEINISGIVWHDKNRLSVEVVGESETKPRGLFKVPWSRRQVAEIEFLEMPAAYCEAIGIQTPCYLVAHASERDELKAPFGKWYVTNEDVPDIYTGLPSVGDPVHMSLPVSTKRVKAASQ